MDDRRARLTRRELYDLIWSEPIFRLAKRFNLSNVGLAKICKRNNVPRPPRGYWAQKQAGQRVKQTPLPKGDDTRIIEIRRYPYAKPLLDDKTAFVRKAIPVPLADPVVPEALKDPHPLIQRSMDALASQKIDETGIVIPSRKDCLNVQVSPKELPRAMRIMDSLIKALATLGFAVSLSAGLTKVDILDVSLSIRLGEGVYRRRLRAKDHELGGYYDFGYKLYEKLPIPSGRLFLAIEGLGFYLDNNRLRWRDTESKRLENSLKSFITGLIKIAALKKPREPD